MPTKPISRYFKQRKSRSEWRKRRNYGTAAGKRNITRALSLKYNPKTLVNQGLGFPRSSLVTLRYSKKVSLAGTPSHLQSFRANGIFDPDSTGAGHQPMGFDQWSAFYSKYKVRSFTVSVKAVLDGTTPTGMAFCVENDTSVSTDLAELAERNSGDIVIAPTSGNGTISFLKTYNMTDVAGQSVEDEDYSALVSSDPAKTWYWHMRTTAMDGASAIAGDALVVISYNVEFTDPNDLAQS